ncbi:MAG: hypothetical protein NT149_00825 [Candidatus Gottesmanbacteria bacterium]|nr:hypothetical protein [Candidatus Gottesmanbacteria bacterium]
MKFWFIVILICVAVFILCFPLVNKERLCYEASQTSLDTITDDIIARGIPLSTQCERSADALYTLETCIRDATKSSAIASRANSMIQRIVATVRLSGTNLWMLKAEHNEECTDFSSSQLP